MHRLALERASLLNRGVVGGRVEEGTVRRQPVLLEDVARVAEGAQFKRGDGSINGRRGVVFTLVKQPHVDTRELPSDRMLKAERAAQVRQAIAQLPRKQRGALVLRVYHDMPHREIAQMLGYREASVRQVAVRAKRRFIDAFTRKRALEGDPS